MLVHIECTEYCNTGYFRTEERFGYISYANLDGTYYSVCGPVRPPLQAKRHVNRGIEAKLLLVRSQSSLL